MKWLKYLWIPFTIMISAFLVYVCRKRHIRIPDPTVEIEAISAESHYKQMAAELGAQHAIDSIEDTYRLKMQKLEVHQRLEARELQKDPGKLAAYLVRAAR